MELVARKADLVRELQFFQQIVERKNTIPILANVLIEATGSEITLLATDLEVTLRSRAEAAGIAIDVEGALTALCANAASFADLERADLLSALRPRGLDRAAPERLRLPGGREVRVHYDPGKPPWIESRLQDFFGMRETPKIHGEPVVVHLLAPNRRPVQVTRDLQGFWERLYPQVRRELMRRYPKHKWPERPE